MAASKSPFPNGLQHIIRENEPLAPMTWLKIGGPARYFAEPTSENELVQLVQACHANSIPLRVLGGGSNLLFAVNVGPRLIVKPDKRGHRRDEQEQQSGQQPVSQTLDGGQD